MKNENPVVDKFIKAGGEFIHVKMQLTEITKSAYATSTQVYLPSTKKHKKTPSIYPINNKISHFPLNNFEFLTNHPFIINSAPILSFLNNTHNGAQSIALI